MILILCLPKHMINELSAALVKHFKVSLIAIKNMIETVYFILQAGFYFYLFFVQVFDVFHIVILFGVWLELDIDLRIR